MPDWPGFPPVPEQQVPASEPPRPETTLSPQDAPEIAAPAPPPPPGLGERVRSFLRWFKARENIAVCVMAAVVLGLHVPLIDTPHAELSTPEWMRQDQAYKDDNTRTAPAPQYIFDELHYIPEAIRFLHREYPEQEHGIVRGEHPPLSKWLIASGIVIFGDNPVGWRLLPILFGIASIFIFYLICRRLVRQEPGISGSGETSPPAPLGWRRWLQASVFVPVFATFLFASENMSFVQAQVAMLDVFYLTFMLLGIFFYLRGNPIAAGIFMGLSMLGKAMAALAILGIAVHWVVTRRDQMAGEVRFTWNALLGIKGVPSTRSDILGMMKFLVAIPVVWLALLALLELAATHTWSNPISRTISMLTSHLGLTFNSSSTSTTGIATRPWEWLYYPGGLYYWYTPRFIGAIGWTVWALVMPAMAYMGYEIVRGRLRGHAVATFALSWFIGVYGLLIPLELATARYMYHFYFYTAIPPVALAIAWGTWRLWEMARAGRRTRVIFFSCLGVYLLGTVATFVLMSPYGTDIITLPSLSG